MIWLIAAWHSVRAGLDVYLFLAGMMLLAEIARAEGLFEWAAAAALRLAGDSPPRLFALVFGVCAVVTIVLSNDATAVVLTPAVATVVERARVAPLPYLFACAFVANAASFVLPISNPANLVVYDGGLPHLVPWIDAFALPSLAALGATFLLLRWHARDELARSRMSADDRPSAPPLRRRALAALSLAVAVMVAASFLGRPIGVVTALAALLAFTVTVSGSNGTSWRVLARIDAAVLLLVAGLFALAGVIDRAGALTALRELFAACVRLDPLRADVAGAFLVGMAANAVNNLPVGLAVQFALDRVRDHATFVQAVLIGVDLGPNLSITGSLATLLWLAALRRAGIPMSGARFLRAGIIVMPPALLLAILALR